jgi:ankyrin repeat protein
MRSCAAAPDSCALTPVLKVGGTALMFAASNGHAGVIQLLLLRGADVSARDAAGNTAADVAAAVPPRQEAVRAALRGVRAAE